MVNYKNFLRLIVAILWVLGPLSVHAAFQITRPQPDFPHGQFQYPMYYYATVSYGGGAYAVFGDFDYEDYTGGAYAQEFVSRVSAQGQVLDSIPLLITLKMGGWYAKYNTNESVSGPGFDGQNFLMVVHHRDSLVDTLLFYGSRIGPSGPLLDSVGRRLVNNVGGQSNDALALGDSLYLMIWDDARKGYSLIYGARIRKDLTVVEPDGFRVNLSDTASQGDGLTALAYNGRIFLAVWDWAAPSSYNRYLWAARVREDGAVLDTVPIKLNRSPTSRHRNTAAPNIATDGQNFLVAFLYEDSIQACQYIAAVRVTGGGVVLDTIPIRISKECGLPSEVGLTYNGHDYQVVWTDSMSQYVQGARVSPGGVVKDTVQGPLFPSSPENQINPFAASDQSGKVLVVWARPLYTDPNIYGAFLDTTGREVGAAEMHGLPGGGSIVASLSPPYPNPMRGKCEISFSLPASKKIRLAVYDALGRKVRELLDGPLDAGPHLLQWDVRDEKGFLLPSGVYFLRLEVREASLTRKFVVIR